MRWAPHRRGRRRECAPPARVGGAPRHAGLRAAKDSCRPGAAITIHVDPLDRLRDAGRRVTDPFEALAQRVAERVLDLVVSALDMNALLDRVDVDALVGRVDVNGLLDRVNVPALLDRADVNEILDRVDVGALLDRVDVNDLVRRVDVDALVEQTDVGAVIARSSGGAASEALDAVRSQVVGLDQFIDRWVQRALRRKHPAPPGPPALVNGSPAP
jgi:hypothetical protein